MRQNVAAMLDSIDTMLASTTEEGVESAKELWNVLTALRGPDVYDGGTNARLKNSFTVQIRSAAFPKTAAKMAAVEKFGGEYAPIAGNPMFEPFGPLFPGDSMAARTEAAWGDEKAALQGHFLSHTSHAAQVLGIWNKK